jgi:proline iminopeptidase
VPLLFVHGHGAGVYHFMHYQGELLSDGLRLVAVEQRGVLRSAPVAEGARLDLEILLEDYEAVREQLGIERWVILGHSAGGNYAAAYAARYPESVSAVIFDCPTWDFDLSDRYRLPIFAALYDESGEHEQAAACRGLAGLKRQLTADDRTYELAFGLGERFRELFFHDKDRGRAFYRLGESAPFTEEMWARGNSHFATLPDLYDSKIPLLGTLTQPTLLLHGADDFSVTPDGVDAYRNDVANPRDVVFAGSGHFPFAEEPVRYAEVVRAFIREVSGR